MVKVKILHEDFNRWFRRLVLRVERQVAFAVAKGSKRIARELRESMGRGLGAGFTPMSPVKSSTIDMPIRVATDKRIRRSVNPSMRKAVLATGALAKSIKEKRKDRWEYIIQSTTAHGNIVLSNNAGPSRKAGFGKNRKQKVKRDPMQVTSIHIGMIEKEILNQLDKAFR